MESYLILRLLLLLEEPKNKLILQVTFLFSLFACDYPDVMFERWCSAVQ